MPSVGGRPARIVPRRVLCEIIEPRVEELFALVQRAIADTGYQDLLGAGAVVTGGSTILEGMPELAESVLQMPVRRGIPTGVGGLVDVVRSPMYSTGVGLVLYGARYGTETNFRVREENVYDKVMRRMGDWLKEIF